MPMPPPITPATRVAANPTRSEVRAPYISSVIMSMPPSSRPSRCCLEGRPYTGPTRSCRPYGARTGARTAMRTKARTTLAPTAATGRSRITCQTNPPFRRAGTTSAVTPGSSPRIGAVLTGTTSRGDPRVEAEIQEVRRQIEEHHHQGQHEEGPLQHRAVTFAHRQEDRPADPRPAENRLDEDLPGHDVTERDGHQRHRREHRVPKRMAPNHRPGLQPLGPGSQHVVLTQRLEHGRTHDQRVFAVQRERHRHRGPLHV